MARISEIRTRSDLNSSLWNGNWLSQKDKIDHKTHLLHSDLDLLAPPEAFCKPILYVRVLSKSAMTPPTKGAGILLRLYKPGSELLPDPPIDVPRACITKITTVTSTDDKVTSGASNAGFLYHAKHISRFLLEGAYEHDPAYSEDPTKFIDRLVYKRISQLSQNGHENQENSSTALPGSAMVCVVITPKDSNDYLKWYEEEH